MPRTNGVEIAKPRALALETRPTAMTILAGLLRRAPSMTSSGDLETRVGYEARAVVRAVWPLHSGGNGCIHPLRGRRAGKPRRARLRAARRGLRRARAG